MVEMLAKLKAVISTVGPNVEGVKSPLATMWATLHGKASRAEELFQKTQWEPIYTLDGLGVVRTEGGA